MSPCTQFSYVLYSELFHWIFFCVIKFLYFIHRFSLLFKRNNPNLFNDQIRSKLHYNFQTKTCTGVAPQDAWWNLLCLTPNSPTTTTRKASATTITTNRTSCWRVPRTTTNQKSRTQKVKENWSKIKGLLFSRALKLQQDDLKKKSEWMLFINNFNISDLENVSKLCVIYFQTIGFFQPQRTVQRLRRLRR